MSSAAIARPGKFICVGLNYRDHAEESEMELPKNPLLFAKWTSSIIGDGDNIVLPSFSTDIDYEGELGVVIGKRIRDVTPEEGLAAVAGYTCVNDVTVRDIQVEEGQWTRSKSFDTFGPVGPRVVPADEIPNPQNLAIRTYLNGEVVQESSTSNMVFSVGEVIAFASRNLTLEPGDLIAMGTPAGVGEAKKPPRFLRNGDTVTVEIEHIGRLTNNVVQGA